MTHPASIAIREANRRRAERQVAVTSGQICHEVPTRAALEESINKLWQKKFAGFDISAWLAKEYGCLFTWSRYLTESKLREILARIVNA